MHERIVRAAAEELRRNGIAGIGIPALMKRAGLTHGAFHAHFPNRNALVAEAIRAASAARAEGPLADELPRRRASSATSPGNTSPTRSGAV